MTTVSAEVVFIMESDINYHQQYYLLIGSIFPEAMRMFDQFLSQIRCYP